uniref:C2 domain-containing protein n=1 Tax=Picea sitchensis TaxID=3332 RepID=A9P2H1_PICSI|nr:unknown [Picea sitchensis]
MEACGRRVRPMVVNLEILEARNVTVKPSSGRDSLFVRYYLSTGNGQTNNIAVNSTEVMAKADPEWKQTFCLDCGWSIENGNIICELQKQFVRFELRERSSRVRVLGSMFRASKLVGWIEIPWKKLLASPTLSIWFPLIPINTSVSGGSQRPPSLHLAICLKPLDLVDSVSWPRTEMEIYDPQVNEIRRNYLNLNRRIRRLERNDCRCGGKICCPGAHEEGIFAVV